MSIAGLRDETGVAKHNVRMSRKLKKIMCPFIVGWL